MRQPHRNVPAWDCEYQGHSFRVYIIGRGKVYHVDKHGTERTVKNPVMHSIIIRMFNRRFDPEATGDPT